jgi:RNA polymerase sigma-70 factor (family 1)
MSCYKIHTDQELAHLLRDSDEYAFTEIHNRYYGILYRHAYKNLADEQEVEDILQDVFIYLWHNRQSIDADENIAAYLYTAVRNKMLNNFRHSKVKQKHISSLQAFINSHQPETDESIRLKQLTAIIEAEVSQLPPKMRQVFEMSRNGHLSHQQIAEQLQISTHTVKKQVNNSLKVLRLKLSSKFFLFFF